MSVRGWLKDTLTVPTGWVWIGEQRVPDQISKTTVITKHARIQPLEEGGIGQLRHEVLLTVFSPMTKVQTAEDDLDHAVALLLTELSGHDQINFIEAAKVAHPNEQYFGWDITLSVITNPEES